MAAAAALSSTSEVVDSDGKTSLVTSTSIKEAKPHESNWYAFSIWSLPREDDPTVYGTIRRLVVGTADQNLGLTAAVIAELRLKEIGTCKTRFGYNTKTYEPVNVKFFDHAERRLEIKTIDVYLLDPTKGSSECVIGWQSVSECEGVKQIVLDGGKVQIIGK